MMPNRVGVFEPTKSKWYIIYYTSYEKFRNKNEAFKNFADIEAAARDAKNFKEGILGFGANPNDIETMENPTYNEWS